MGALLVPLLAGCTGVGLGGDFTQVVNEHCILLDGTAVQLPRGVAARIEDETLVQDPLIGRDTVIARIGDPLTGSASSRMRTAGACGPDHDSYFDATGLQVDTPGPTPSESE